MFKTRRPLNIHMKLDLSRPVQEEDQKKNDEEEEVIISSLIS